MNASSPWGARTPSSRARMAGPVTGRSWRAWWRPAKLNGVEPLAWLTDVLERVVLGRIKTTELARLLPWNWKAERLAAAVHA
jgi:IS66 C-terminal element